MERQRAIEGTWNGRMSISRIATEIVPEAVFIYHCGQLIAEEASSAGIFWIYERRRCRSVEMRRKSCDRAGESREIKADGL
jgi:hypothetical protein